MCFFYILLPLYFQARGLYHVSKQLRERPGYRQLWRELLLRSVLLKEVQR